MKALLSVEPGGPETLRLQEVSLPEPGRGELRIRVIACAINYPDALMIEDKYQLKPPRPFAPGCEIAGVVDKVGSDVAGWAPGDRLIAVTQSGGLSEQIVIDAREGIRLPAEYDPVEGATLVFTYATSLHALEDRAGLKPGETLLILGAAGGVGMSAIEIGKAMGAVVVAAVSSDQKAAAARAAGADRTIVYPRGPFGKDEARALADAFKQLVGSKGADVIYDPVGGDYAEPALRSIAWEGRYLVVGFAGGIPRLPLNLPLLKSCDVRGVLWGAFKAREPGRHAAHVNRLLDWWRDGRIRPRVGAVYPFDRAGEAIACVAGRSAIGKLVVAVSEEARLRAEPI